MRINLAESECTPSEVLSWRVGQKFYALMNPNRERATRKGYQEARRVAQLRCDIHELIEVADSNGSDCEGLLKELRASGDEDQYSYHRKVVDDFIVFIDGIDVDPSGSFGAELSDRAVYGGGW